MSTPPVALTIASTDSAGGAGIHADLRTFAAHRVHGASAIAAVTAQNTMRVSAVHLIPPDVVEAQIEAVLEDLPVAAVKTGMLAHPTTVEVVARFARDGRLPNLVVDPVLVNGAGTAMFDPAMTRLYRERLLPSAMVATPNRLEAALLCNRSVETINEMAEAAMELSDLGPATVIVKGGDALDEGDESVDAVANNGSVSLLRSPRVVTRNDHGSGCSLAAAIVASLATGLDLTAAIQGAKDFVHAGLVGAVDWDLGGGRGPLDQLGWSTRASAP